MSRRKKNFLSCLILFSLTIMLTNFCVALLFYPVVAGAAKPTSQDHFDCARAPAIPLAKIKIASAKTNGALMPCCVERNQQPVSNLFATEKPLLLAFLAFTSADSQILKNTALADYSGTLWPPPEQLIIDSTIIRV